MTKNSFDTFISMDFFGIRYSLPSADPVSVPFPLPLPAFFPRLVQWETEGRSLGREPHLYPATGNGACCFFGEFHSFRIPHTATQTAPVRQVLRPLWVGRARRYGGAPRVNFYMKQGRRKKQRPISPLLPSSFSTLISISSRFVGEDFCGLIFALILSPRCPGV